MNLKILIIDDDEQDLKVMQRYLSQVGYEDIKTAQTGDQGLQEARAEAPNIIILDTNLPGMNGFEICQKIKEMSELSTKIIMMTGNAEAIDAKAAREAGADEYCVKTSDCALLIEAVERLSD